ncbi:LytTR family DNA-binding domain-containing protein [bacterium]|nr:LytTR family DNA-binding domain-containing protein [bacterium]
MKTKVLIVEDEMPSARKLKAFLLDIEPIFEIVEILESISQTVEFLKSQTVDLIFLDIQLADGNSFAIFKQVEVSTPIIFTTAFNQYAIEAFTQNSIGYLLKPLSKEALAGALKKFNNTRQTQNNSASIIDYQLIGRMVAQQQYPEYQERFMVYFKDKILTIPVEDVAYFYANGNSVFLCLHTGQSYDINFTLEQLEAKLNPKYFFRANRQFITNVKAVKEALVYSKSKLKLILTPNHPEEVIISSLKTAKFKLWLSQ